MPSLQEILAAKLLASSSLGTSPAALKTPLLDRIKQAAEEALAAESPSVAPSVFKTTRIIPDVDQILPRIRALYALADENLEDEMRLLKEALLQNPDASALLLPEDVGLLVTGLRRIVGESIAAALEGKGKKKAKALSVEEIDKAFEEL